MKALNLAYILLKVLIIGEYSLALGVFEKLNIGLFNTLDNKFRNEFPQQNATYDFIIVGAGAAGCALANRLTENPNWSVYLLEAGGIENIAHLIPTLAVYLQSTYSNWNYHSVPQKYACFGMNDNKCALPRGKVLGGTSSINFMIYNRGNRRDFDRWAAAGNYGWSYKDVLPYFLKSENAQLFGKFDASYHNISGPLSVQHLQFRTQMVHAFIEGAQQAGHVYTDYNGESQIGTAYVQSTTQQGRRHSGYRAFLQPIQMRKNLHILTFARVTRVLIDSKTKIADGVECLYKRKYYRFTARKEVILSAGAFNSPQLLMLSGIGPKADLDVLKIPVVQSLPVGQRLYDHMSHFGPTFITNTTTQTIYPSNLKITDLAEFFLHGSSSTFLSSIGGVESLTFLKVPGSTEPADMPDIELITVAGSLASDEGTGLKLGANFKDMVYDQLFKSLALTKQDHFTVLVIQ